MTKLACSVNVLLTFSCVDLPDSLPFQRLLSSLLTAISVISPDLWAAALGGSRYER